MTHNDVFGEIIQPRAPEILLGAHKPRRRRISCPDIVFPYEYDECKLEDQEGYVGWDDVFRLASAKIGFLYPAQSTKEAVTVALNRMTKLTMESTKPTLSPRKKSLSVNDLSRDGSRGTKEAVAVALSCMTKLTMKSTTPAMSQQKRLVSVNNLSQDTLGQDAGVVGEGGTGLNSTDSPTREAKDWLKVANGKYVVSGKISRKEVAIRINKRR